jgi:hypothetical protein
MNHFPDDELLSAYLDGELTTDERATVDRWLTESAEHRQLLEELRSLSQSLESLPRLRLEDDFYQSVLRRAEREMLSAGPSAETGKSSVDALVARAVTDAAAATKSKGEPIAVRREQQDAISADSVHAAATGRRLPWPRGKRPWVYAGLAIAAGVLVMVFSPPPADQQHIDVAFNPAGGRGEVNNRAELKVQQETGRQISVEAVQPDVALRSAAHDRPEIDGQSAVPSTRRKAAAVEQNNIDGPTSAGFGGGGGGARGMNPVAAREAGVADAKSGKLGDVAQDAARNFRSVVAGPGGYGNGVADKQSDPGQAGEGLFANGLAVVEVTLSPEGLKSDAIRRVLAREHIVLEDEIALLAGTVNGNRFNNVNRTADRRGIEQSNLASTNALAAKAATAPSSGDQSGGGIVDPAIKDGRAKGEAAKTNENAVMAGAAKPAENRASAEAGPGGLAADKNNFGRFTSTDEVVLVEADAEQIDATLAYLHAHPELFVKVDISPAPKVEAQQGWSSYNRGLGEQVNEQVKLAVQKREDLQQFHDSDEAAGQQRSDPKHSDPKNSDEKLRFKPQYGAIANQPGDDKKTEKAAAERMAPVAPAKPAVDLQTADKQLTDKPTKDLQDGVPAKNRDLANGQPAGPQPMPTGAAPLAKKPADAANATRLPEVNGAVATQPAAPPAAAIAGKDAKDESPEAKRFERKAGEKEADQKNLPQDAGGVAKDESGSYRSLGRARRLTMQFDAPAPSNAEQTPAPALQQQGGARPASKPQPSDVAKRVGDLKPANAAPTNTPIEQPKMPEAPTAGAAAAPLISKSDAEATPQATDKLKALPRQEGLKVLSDKDRLAKPGGEATGGSKPGENQQAAQVKKKEDVGDAKGSKKELETSFEKQSMKSQQPRQPPLANDPAPHNYQRAMIVIRIQQPAPTITGAPAATAPVAPPAKE